MTPLPPEWPLLPQMVDVAPLAPVSWWPQTLGWQLLVALWLLALMLLLVQSVRRYHFYRYRRLALARLASLSLDDMDNSSQLFLLLKQTACRVDPALAPRLDRNLLETLDQMTVHGGNIATPQFATPLGERWLQALIEPGLQLDPQERHELYTRTAHWLRHHSHPSAPRLWPRSRR